MMLLSLVVFVAVGAQTDCGLQYDGNGDGAVDAMDLLGLLSEYSDTCESAFGCGHPLLFDGYFYGIVQIGEQCWFKENLRTEHYANGNVIPGGLSNSEWENAASGAQTVYGEGISDCEGHCDEVQNLEDYGRLYNWYAVEDSRGLCPSGWHVPADGEWMTLEMELGMNEYEANATGWRGTDQGTQMKSSASDTPSWNGTNNSGFSGLPGGFRGSAGHFHDENDFGCWWSASPSGTTSAWFRELYSFTATVYRNHPNQRIGFSVRCIRDE